MECHSVEFFIEKVRKSPCLWNINHVAYRNTPKKDLAWERVAKECAMANGVEAKLQWKKLKDSHREALRRRNPSSGASALNLKPWKYEEKMKFVLTKTEVKESTSFSNNSNLIQDPDETSMDTNVTAEVIVPKPQFSEPLPYAEQSFTDQAFQNEEYRERDERRIHAFDMNRSDGLSKLFEGFCQKTRELPRYLQLRVQREIFDAIYRAEEEVLSLSEPIKAFSSSLSFPQETNRPPSIDRVTQSDDLDSEYERKCIRQSLDS